MPSLTILGLGPGSPGLISRAAWDTLCNASEVWTVAPKHPVFGALPATVHVRSLLGMPAADDAQLVPSWQLAERAVALLNMPDGAVLALPGHPLIDNPIGREIRRACLERGVPVHIIASLSAVDAALAQASNDQAAKVSICSFEALESAHVPPFPPGEAALVTSLTSKAELSRVGAVLSTVYPASHLVAAIPWMADDGALPMAVPVGELASLSVQHDLSCVYVPPLPKGSSLEHLQEVVAHLRAPDGCPWDREQTHATLRRHLLEEAYELMAALDSGNSAGMQEELGDLLLQILMNAQIASEAGAFTLNDVFRGIHEKLIRRHPHVFAGLDVQDVDGVLTNWERLKEGEREETGRAGGLLEGVPLELPSLSQAQGYQERAGRVGFDWPDLGGVLDKIGEEIQEFREAQDSKALSAELGDLLFALVNLARWKEIDAEAALRGSNMRFKRRFGFIEAGAAGQQKHLSDLSVDEMNALWELAKKVE